MKYFMKEWAPYILIIIIIITIRTFIITPVIVRGDSMYDTLNDGEVLLLSKINYKMNEIKRYDIAVIKDERSGFIIKRVIGLPGDNIEYKDNKLYINGILDTNKFTNDKTKDFTLEDICIINDIECNGKIPEDMYLVLGDNRDVSADSRIKGLIKKDKIIGKAIFRLWPLSKFEKVK